MFKSIATWVSAFVLVMTAGVAPALAGGASPALQAALEAQPGEVRARYDQRHPGATLSFFGVEPGMTVVEALPGAGWYSKILVPYLGPKGRLIGADYAQDMWPLFGFFSEEFIESRKSFVQEWPQEAETWGGDSGAKVQAFKFGSMPEAFEGTADAVLLIRALHNLARFESGGEYLSKALKNAYAALRPGGIAGVVQHHARDDMPDEWADGSRGYLKKAFVIQAMEDAGFEYVASSDVNANPKDQPTTEDVVWRLSPSFATSGDDEELRASLAAVGESNRMTLKFRKPVAE